MLGLRGLPTHAVAKAIVPSEKLAIERLGSSYGGWKIPVDLPTASWICYCVGVGEDATFEVELIRRYGCIVHSFDPTPKSIEYAAVHLSGQSQLHFHPIGLWCRDECRKFYAPADSQHVSHSITNLQATDRYFVAECKRLSTIMEELGHTSIDLLKIDIEGAEYDSVKDILSERIPIGVLCVEVHAPWRALRAARMLQQLRRSGFKIAAVEGMNLTFVHATVARGRTSF